MIRGLDQHTLAVGDADGDQRIDRFLAAGLAGLSRQRVQALIRDGRVSRGGRTIEDASVRVKPGEVYVVDVPPPVQAAPAAERIALEIVLEDEHLIVIDKPAGLVVHPAAGHEAGTLVNALIAHCGESLSGIGGVMRPGIVHRLDKDTSGLLVVAKTDAAHRGLAAQFEAHGRDGRLGRAYLALAWGVPHRPAGTIDAPLMRSRTDRTRIAVSSGPDARPAITHFALAERYRDEERKPLACLLRLELETGRTHQIRVHLAHIRHPVMGDQVYSSGFKASAARLSPGARSALADLGRQALHATHLGFEHPVTGKAISLDSPPPDDFARLRDELRLAHY